MLAPKNENFSFQIESEEKQNVEIDNWYPILKVLQNCSVDYKIIQLTVLYSFGDVSTL